MNITEKLLKEIGFLGSNETLYRRIWATEVKQLSAHVGLRQILNEDGHLTTDIVLDSQTKKKHIQDAWKEIKKVIESSARVQGHDLSDYFQLLLYELLQPDYALLIYDENAPSELPTNFRYKNLNRKPEYRDLYMDTNFDALVFTVRLSKRNEDLEKAKLADHYLRSLLRSFNMVDDDIDDWVEAAVDDIRKGDCPSDINSQPIDFDKFANVLENLRKQYGGEKRHPQSKSNMLRLYALFVIWGDWEEAAKLLNKRFCREIYQKYEPRLNARLDDILREITTSTSGNTGGTMDFMET